MVEDFRVPWYLRFLFAGKTGSPEATNAGAISHLTFANRSSTAAKLTNVRPTRRFPTCDAYDNGMLWFIQGERRFYLGAVVDDLFLSTVSDTLSRSLSSDRLLPERRRRENVNIRAVCFPS